MPLLHLVLCLVLVCSILPWCGRVRRGMLSRLASCLIAIKSRRIRLLDLNGVYTRRLKTVVGSLVVVMVVTVLMYTPATHTAFTYTTAQLSGEVAAGGGDGEGGGVQTEPSCTPSNHLFFLKTHKCASSTVQNILFRYGYSRNLTFALPKGGNYLGHPKHFKAGMLPKELLPKSGLVDIFAVHSRLNPPENTKILYPDARWITVVREPATLYESLFNYYHMQGFYGFSLKEFGNITAEHLADLPRLGNKLGRNQMLFDLGYSAELDVADLRRAIDELDARFDIVLISERMDESLILLRHLLCWNLSDIVVFTKNARRTEVKPGLDAKTLNALRELNSADVILYEHFLARHKEAVHAFGENRMKEELAALRGLRDEYYEECGLREVKGRDNQLKFKEYSGLVSSYVVNNTNDTTCLILSLPELPMVQMARMKQEAMLKEEEEEEEEKKKKVERRSGDDGGGGGDSGGSDSAPPPAPPPPPPPPSSSLGNS